MRFNYSLFFLSLLFLSILVGCSSTKLVESWSDSSLQTKPLKKILILGVMRNDLQRRMYEDVFAKRITKGDVIGIPGYTVMPDPKDYDEKREIKAAVQQSEADAALIAQLVAVEKQEKYVPPSYSYVPSYGYRYGLYDYYGMSHQTVSTPGYTTIDTVVRLETTVFSTATDKMIWAGSTRSFNPSSAESIVKKNADLIVADMKKAGLM
jgi:hypothetical protein